ncbi:MAG: NADAR family protein [Actinobacteria bacterium]|nr:NADAR family protein [Actinomycetota bacterium]
MTPKIINFYHRYDSHGELSNFAEYPITLEGLQWPTSEHYFQAQKFAGTKHAERIRLAKHPRTAAKIGKDRTLPLRADWPRVKEDIMFEALRAKFTQHQNLRDLLLSTGDAILVEHTRNDSYWGDGGDGSGKNRLGVLLMRLREELRGCDESVASADPESTE